MIHWCFTTNPDFDQYINVILVFETWQTYFCEVFCLKNATVVSLFQILNTHSDVSEILYINRPIRPVVDLFFAFFHKRYNIIVA